MKRILHYLSSPWFLPLAICLIVATCAYTPAMAQRVPPQIKCGDAQQMATHLASKYNETLVSMGVSLSGSLMQVYASPGGETWTVLVLSPNGPACIVAAGHNWQSVPASITGGDLA